MNHRGLQRALFRMRLDPAFARAIRGGEARACASTDLTGAELELLRKADPAGISADPRGDARAQSLRNLSSEFALSKALLGDDGAIAFFASDAFHESVRGERSLPLAFGAYLATLEVAPAVRAIATLEGEMAAARRETREVPPTARGQVTLAPWARLTTVRDGTLALATRVREALDAGRGAPRARLPDPPRTETILLVATARRPAFGLRDVEAERLTPLVARFLAEAEPRALSGEDRRAYAEREDACPDDLELLCSALLGEGALVGSLD